MAGGGGLRVGGAGVEVSAGGVGGSCLRGGRGEGAGEGCGEVDLGGTGGGRSLVSSLFSRSLCCLSLRSGFCFAAWAVAFALLSFSFSTSGFDGMGFVFSFKCPSKGSTITCSVPLISDLHQGQLWRAGE